MSEETIRLEVIPADDETAKLYDAIDNASDQDRKTWIEDAKGRRIAAIVPVDVAEREEQAIAEVLATPVGSASAALRARLREQLTELGCPVLGDSIGFGDVELEQWVRLVALAMRGQQR